MADDRFQKPEVVITQPRIGISSKFNVQINFDIPKPVLSLKPKPEVDIQLNGRHLEKID